MEKINLQDTFLNASRKEKTGLTIYLVNGIRLTGTVQSFDNFTILLKSEGRQQLIYKHAVSTIVPEKEIKLM